MPVYKIFLSFSSSDETLAREVRKTINDAFKGAVELFFSSADILPGTEWKLKISESLKEYDAILLILTPHYIKRPWAYIEWSAFWLNNKKAYLVITEGVDIQELVSPMRDTQIAGLFNESDVKKLFIAIAADAQFKDPIPYSDATKLAIRSKTIYDDIKYNEEKIRFSPYKTNLELLPNDDIKKKEIFWYFYDKESDEAAAARIFERINDNSLKGDILQKLVEKGDYELIEKTFEFVESKNNLLPLLKALVQAGHENSSLLEKILDYIKVGQTALRSFGEFLISNIGDQSKTLPLLLPHFSNMAELRKLGQFLVDNGYTRSHIFDKIVSNMAGKNNAEWQKLLIYLIDAEQNYNPAEIKEQVEKLAKMNQREAEKVIHKLIDKDIETVKELIYQKKVITVEEIRTRIEERIKEKQRT